MYKTLFFKSVIWILGFLIFGLLSVGVYLRTPFATSGVLNIKTTTGGYGHSLLRFNEASKLKETDVLFLGSSHTYRGFDTRIFKEYGIDSFNLGSSAQTPLNTYYLLQRYLENIDVKLLVLETYWVMASNPTGVESTIDINSNTTPNSLNFQMTKAGGAVDGYGSYFGALSEQLTRTDRLNEGRQRQIKDNNYISGGFVETTRDYTEGAVKIPTPNSKTIKLDQTQLEYVKKIAQLALDNNIKIMFVRAPVSGELLSSVKNYQDSSQPFEQIAKSFDAKFIDFNTDPYYSELSLDLMTDFYDLSHLTQNGVERFNRLLAPKINSALAT